MTNTAVCDAYEGKPYGKVTKCYMSWDEKNKKWVEGCAIRPEIVRMMKGHKAGKVVEEKRVKAN